MVTVMIMLNIKGHMSRCLVRPVLPYHASNVILFAALTWAGTASAMSQRGDRVSPAAAPR